MPLQTVREQVTVQLRDELVAGEYPGGHVLREIKLAKRWGVSRGPVRDELLQLSQEGFLAYQTNCGMTVRHPPNPKNREFIVSLRVQIELFAVEAGLQAFSDESLDRVKSALRDMKQACAGDDAAAVARCDMAFHEAILVGCGGEDFVPSWRQFCAKMLLSYTRLENYREVYDEHLDILVPLRDRNTQAVLTALQENIL